MFWELQGLTWRQPVDRQKYASARNCWTGSVCSEASAIVMFEPFFLAF